MKHPTLANWIQIKKCTENEYIINDLLLDEQFKMDSYTVWFAKQLDGKTNPYRIDKRLSKNAVDMLVSELESENIIREKNFLSKSPLNLLVTVWSPRVTLKLQIISFFLIGLLLISWFPLLVFSVYYFIFNLYDLSLNYITIGSFTGLFIGMILHELGHMVACLGYGGRVFEVGIMFQFLLPGAYVLLNESNIKKRMRRIQVSAAGIEMNLLLAAIFLILSAQFEPSSGFFLGASIQNIFLALLNLTLIDGFDGMAIMSELLGVEELIDKVKRIAKSRLKKQRIIKDGMSGKATIVACYILMAIQIALPLVFALNIVGVVSWFT